MRGRPYHSQHKNMATAGARKVATIIKTPSHLHDISFIAFVWIFHLCTQKGIFPLRKRPKREAYLDRWTDGRSNPQTFRDNYPFFPCHSGPGRRRPRHHWMHDVGLFQSNHPSMRRLDRFHQIHWLQYSTTWQERFTKTNVINDEKDPQQKESQHQPTAAPALASSSATTNES